MILIVMKNVVPRYSKIDVKTLKTDARITVQDACHFSLWQAIWNIITGWIVGDRFEATSGKKRVWI